MTNTENTGTTLKSSRLKASVDANAVMAEHVFGIS